MSTLAQIDQNRDLVVSMIRELRTNYLVLDRLSNSYRVFRFTGGSVPNESWDVIAITAYLRWPFAADRISSAAVERYLRLAKEIVDEGREINAAATSRSLRCRSGIAAMFDRSSSEISALASTLDDAMTSLVEKAPQPI